MKISTSLFFDRTVDQMINTQTTLANNQTKLSTGKNVVNPSDAPDKATAIQTCLTSSYLWGSHVE